MFKKIMRAVSPAPVEIAPVPVTFEVNKCPVTGWYYKISDKSGAVNSIRLADFCFSTKNEAETQCQSQITLVSRKLASLGWKPVIVVST